MLDKKELSDLRAAVDLLENPSFGVKVADFIGTPIERAIALLPARATTVIGSATRKAIQGALKLSLKTLDHHDPKAGLETPAASNWWHTAATATTGAVGGAFGLIALTIELPRFNRHHDALDCRCGQKRGGRPARSSSSA
jgi:hypothetical protein